MGHTHWFEETKRPKQAIINKVLGEYAKHVVKSTWLEGGILVLVDDEMTEEWGSRRYFIRNCKAYKPRWSKIYELVANDNPLDEEICDEYGLNW